MLGTDIINTMKSRLFDLAVQALTLKPSMCVSGYRIDVSSLKVEHVIRQMIISNLAVTEIQSNKHVAI